MKANTADFTISIPVTGSTKLIHRCLSSITKNTTTNCHIVVTDNCADEETIARIVDLYPNVTLIHNATRMSYAYNQNRVIEQTTSPYILLLNDDTEMVDDVIDRLFEFINERSKHEKIAAVSPRLLNPDLTLQRSTFCIPTVMTVTISYLGFRYLVPYNKFTAWLSGKILGTGRTSRFWDHDETRAVDNIYGAAVLVSREAIEDVGPLDENAQAYFEEIEWHLRFRKKGYKLYYYNDVSVIHHGAVTNNKSLNPNVIFLEAAGLLNMFLKHYPCHQRVYVRLLLIVSSAAKIVFHAVSGLIYFQRWRFVRPHMRIIGLAFRPKFQQV